MANVGVIGAGSWGTALSVLLADNGHHVTIWSIDEKEVEMLDKKREHLTKLPGVKLSDGMTITGDLESAVKGKDFLVLAVPSPFTRATAKKMSAYVGKGQIIVDVAKGIEEIVCSDRRRNPSGGRSGSFRTKPCRRSRKKASDNMCHRSKNKKNGGIFAVCVY